MSDFFTNTEETNTKVSQNVTVSQDKKIHAITMSEIEIENWIFGSDNISDNKLCCLLMGSDGSGKSGLVMSYLTPEDIKQGHKMVILDLDGGAEPLKNTYHKKEKDNIIVRNPLTFSFNESGEVITDYTTSLNKIRSVIKWISENHKKFKIKAVCFDGLSTMLSHAEHIMRIEKNIDPDGGVSLRYWILRQKIFIELLEQIRALPVDKFFIAHEDFIETGEKELSSVKRKTNALMFQKLHLKREDGLSEVKFKAKIIKCKTNVSLEGKEFDFCHVDKTTGKAKWIGSDVITMLKGEYVDRN